MHGEAYIPVITDKTVIIMNTVFFTDYNYSSEN